MLKLHNTLTGTLEEFKSISDGKALMYNCGPTVYNYAHIGNLRSYVFADTLRRTLQYLGYEVTQVINITDVGHLSDDGDEGEDKMTKALKRLGKPMTTSAMREVADLYFEEFKKDLRKLHIELPTYFPFASDHLVEDMKLVETLIEKGFAYKTSDGIYFDTEKDPHYGKLGQLTPISDEQSRIGMNSEKKNPRDFALWKFNNELGYESALGRGFPGWHIECSAMAMKYLGETFDIHTGGIDHIPVHHNNEIAQSESATGKPFAHYWMHNGFVNVESGKMAKSEGNFLSLQTLQERNFLPLAYRYWLLQARYSTQVNFTFEALEAAQQAYKKLVKTWQQLPDGGTSSKHHIDTFQSFIEDDLDTAKSLALIWELLKDDSVVAADKKTTIAEFDKVLGLNISKQPIESAGGIKVEDEHLVSELLAKRVEARKHKDFKTSDEMRDALAKLGYKIEDKPEGTIISQI